MSTESNSEHPEVAADSNQSPAPSDSAASGWRPLRIWIPILLIAAMPVIRLLPSLLDDIPQLLLFVVAAGPALLGIAVLLWWLFLSRANGFERLLGLLAVAVIIGVTMAISDRSMLDTLPIVIFTLPIGLALFGIGAIIMGKRSSMLRTTTAVVLAALGFGYASLQRNDGMWGDYALELDYRWKPTPEQRRAAAAVESADLEVTEAKVAGWISASQWPAFRGTDRNGVYRGPAIDTDWSAHPPELVWKIPVAPGWSSFAIAEPLLFTQEQRDDMESVVCYSADTGKEVWVQQIKSRFEEVMGGVGPRATPTITSDGLFVLGANGHLMRLDPTDGEIVWQTDLRKVADRDPPEWGFCSSPLIVDDVVVVHAGGDGDKGTLAFRIDDGKLKWSAPAGDHSYSSAQLNTVAGQPTILMLTNRGLSLLDPASGEVRLEYEWPHEGYRSLQPQVIEGDSIMIPTGLGTGSGRIQLVDQSSGWSADETWVSRHMKPDFSDFVVHDGYIYGFDRNTFTCIDLETGDRVWKRGRYGSGQVLLLEKSNALLVVSEQGRVVLLAADPSAHQELGDFQALDGKTWNHPVVVGDRLYLRNAKEAACYRLNLAQPTNVAMLSN